MMASLYKKKMYVLRNILYPYYRLFIQKKYIKQLQIILNLNIAKDNTKGKLYIINSIDLASDFQSAVEFILAMYLTKRGSKVVILYDDLLKHIDRETVIMKYSFLSKNKARYLINKIISKNNKNIEFASYSSLISSGGADKINNIAEEIYKNKTYVYNNINIDEDVKSSLIRYIHNGTTDCDSIIKKNHVLSSIFNAIVSIEVAKNSFEKYSPNNVISVHTVYSSWGPFMKYYKNKGVEPIQWSKGQAFEDSIFITKWHNRQNSDMYYAWQLRKEKPINEFEMKVLFSFLEKRFNRASGFTKYIKGNVSDDTVNVINKFEKDNTYAIFPNILWDNALTDADTVFKDVMEWLELTIKYLISIEANIIVRAHPAEVSFMKPTISIIDIIKKITPEINEYSKVVFVKPESSISSYWLIERIKAGIIYNGTLGLEMAIKGVPVVFGGAPPYSEYCGLQFPKTKEDYFEYIINPSLVQSKNQINKKQLLTFMYMYFYEFEIKMPFLNDNEWAKLNFSSAKNILKEGHSVLDRIYTFIDSK